MIRLGVVADDLTGAGDIASMSTKAGRRTEVFTLDAMHLLAQSASEVVVIDTDSRFDTPEVAYDKVLRATKFLLAAGCEQFFKKTCSVFRGNIGAEFDAMLDALGEPFAVVVLGFPQNGRVTNNGVHYVHGRRLADSAFRNDPVHPMTESSLVEILKRQTARHVSLLTQEVVSQGDEVLRQAVGDARQKGGYLILDVLDETALSVIASAVADVRVLCGSSALAEPLALRWPATHAVAPVSPPYAEHKGILCLAGSLTPQTKRQVKFLQAQGVVSLRFEPTSVFDESGCEDYLHSFVGCASDTLSCGQDTLIYTANDPATVRESQLQAQQRGLTPGALGRLISSSLGKIAKQLCQKGELNRLIVAGGDTSATICRALGVTHMVAYREIQPGIPSLLSLPESTASPMLLVLKSGSFGSDMFLREALAHLKEAVVASAP